MPEKNIVYEIKLPLSLKIIFCAIAFGLVANLFKPILNIDSAKADNALSSQEVRQIVEDWCRVSKRSLKIYCDKER